MITIAILHSTIRKEEKLIAEAANKRNIRVKLMDIRNEIFNPYSYKADYDVALERSVSTIKGTYAITFLESVGALVVNPLQVALNCADKFRACLLLKKANIPTPKFALAFSLPQAVRAVEEVGGFPIVIKPPQKAFYIQEFVPKQGRDIRAFVVGGRPAGSSVPWITSSKAQLETPSNV